MTYTQIYFEIQGVRLQASAFKDEWHMMLHVEPRKDLFEGQLKRLYEVEDMLTSLPQFSGARYVSKRYFLSDSTNQEPLMRQESDVAVSCIQQQPLDGSKVAVWLYLQQGADIHTQDGMLVCQRGGYKHLWLMGMRHGVGDSAQQTEALLSTYEAQLARHGATLADNCVRTWFFVRDVDTQYAGMVTARRDNFTRQGLTQDTHYIASTGIQGSPADTDALLQMDAYAIAGAWRPCQQHYLCAPTHLNPTYEYGVTFERGVCLEYGDRMHAIISGTASIDNHGEVLYVGDIVRQTLRMWDNVEALLREADMDFSHVMHFIVYIRDAADYETVRHLYGERFPRVPMVIVLAPVCRPAWLIEMECMACRQHVNPAFPVF